MPVAFTFTDLYIAPRKTTASGPQKRAGMAGPFLSNRPPIDRALLHAFQDSGNTLAHADAHGRNAELRVLLGEQACKCAGDA